MVSVTLTSEVKAGYKDNITPSQLTAWPAKIPENAALSPIYQERGDQRDSYKVFVGLKAVWTELR